MATTEMKGVDSVIVSNNLYYAYNSFQSSYRAIKTAGLWTGKSNASAIKACPQIQQFFYSLGEQFCKLDNSVNLYMILQQVALDLAKTKYNQEAGISITETSNGSSTYYFSIRNYQQSYNSFLKDYNDSIADFRRFSNAIDYSSDVSDTTLLRVDYSLIENVLQNLAKSIDYLEDFSVECSKVVSEAKKISVDMMYVKYYQCINYSSNNLSIIKSNINVLKSILNGFKSKIASFVNRINIFEDSKMSVELQSLVKDSIDDQYQSNSSDAASSLSSSSSNIFDDVDDVAVADDIDASDYEITGLSGILSFDEVCKTNWNINCEQADLDDLASPLAGKMQINTLTSKSITDFSVYDDETNYYCKTGGSYESQFGTHYGTDFSTNGGSMAVSSILSGVVVSSYYETGGGNTIVVLSEVSNDDGTVSYYATKYMHLSSFSKKVGDTVSAGDKIAMSGNSGSKTTGYHLHVESSKVNVSNNLMANCDSASDVVNVYKRNNSEINGSYVDLGSHFYNMGKAFLPYSSKYSVKN